MQSFTIRDIEHLTGIKAHTLRIWELRFAFFQPKRKESKHRFYDNEDLKKLLRISFLYHAGWKISKISVMSDEEISNAVRSISVGAGQYELLITQLLEAAIDFDEKHFVSVFDEVVAVAGFENCIIHVCYPYLKKVGLLWSTNNIIPAQEHFSSYIIQNKIIVETERLPVAADGEKILVFCPKGEYHELPLLFINFLLRKYGRKTVYLGVNVSNASINQVMDQQAFDLVYVHLITNLSGTGTDDYFEQLCRQYPRQTFYTSGAGTSTLQRSFVNLHVLRSDAAIYSFVQSGLTVSSERNF